MKEIRIALLKKEIRFCFPTEEERAKFEKEVEYYVTNETRCLGLVAKEKFLYVRLYVAGNSDIGAIFRVLQQLGYESKE